MFFILFIPFVAKDLTKFVVQKVLRRMLGLKFGQQIYLLWVIRVAARAQPFAWYLAQCSSWTTHEEREGKHDQHRTALGSNRKYIPYLRELHFWKVQNCLMIKFYQFVYLVSFLLFRSSWDIRLVTFLLICFSGSVPLDLFLLIRSFWYILLDLFLKIQSSWFIILIHGSWSVPVDLFLLIHSSWFISVDLFLLIHSCWSIPVHPFLLIHSCWSGLLDPFLLIRLQNTKIKDPNCYIWFTHLIGIGLLYLPQYGMGELPPRFQRPCIKTLLWPQHCHPRSTTLLWQSVLKHKVSRLKPEAPLASGDTGTKSRQ